MTTIKQLGQTMHLKILRRLGKLKKNPYTKPHGWHINVCVLPLYSKSALYLMAWFALVYDLSTCVT